MIRYILEWRTSHLELKSRTVPEVTWKNSMGKNFQDASIIAWNNLLLSQCVQIAVNRIQARSFASTKSGTTMNLMVVGCLQEVEVWSGQRAVERQQ